MQRAGLRDDHMQQSGLIYVLNNLGDNWSGATVKTKWKNQKFVPVAWDGHDAVAPNERITNAEGCSEFPAPPRG
jgi:alpha-amylase